MTTRAPQKRLRPLAELSAHEARAVTGVLFDVDDTVTSRGRLEVVALQAMYRLRESGIRLVAITGRPLGWAEVIAHHWPVDLAVGENGAGFVRVGDDRVDTRYYQDERARAAANAALARLAARVRVELPEVTVAADGASRRCDLAFDVGEHARVPPDTVARLSSIIEEAGMRCVVSSVHAHAVPGPWDKAIGASWAIASVWGQPFVPGEWLFVGDSGNDAAAFAAFPSSVGVANVVRHLARLPTPPRFITPSAAGRGFAELAEHLLEARS